MKRVDGTYTKKVLIVDDEPHIVRVLKLKLKNAGYDVITAVNGRDGLEKFIKEKPAVVISDIQMPHLGGQEMIAMIETHKKQDPYLVIVMTSSIDHAISRWALETKNIHFVEKPFSPNNILNLINGYFLQLQETDAPL